MQSQRRGACRNDGAGRVGRPDLFGTVLVSMGRNRNTHTWISIIALLGCVFCQHTCRLAPQPTDHCGRQGNAVILESVVTVDGDAADFPLRCARTVSASALLAPPLPWVTRISSVGDSASANASDVESQSLA
jgi:hypothetical protein